MMADQDRVCALHLQWEERWDAGECLSPEELCRDCPELLPELKRQIEDQCASKRRLPGHDHAADLPLTLSMVEHDRALDTPDVEVVSLTRASLPIPETRTEE